MKALLHADHGQDILEYALVMAVLALVVVKLLIPFGIVVSQTFGMVSHASTLGVVEP